MRCSIVWLFLIVLALAGQAQSGGLGRIAYIRQGDLWVKALPSGMAKRLTTHGQSRTPRWSPSGQWIAYLNAGKLTVQPAAGGRARMLGQGTDAFAWSPREDLLAYVTGNGALVLVAADDWRARNLVDGFTGSQGLGVASFTWSANGRSLAYTYVAARRDGKAVAAADRVARLWRMNLDGKGAIVLDAGDPAAFLPIIAGWAPNGIILYWRDPLFSASLQADGVPLYAIRAKGRPPAQVTPVMPAYRDFFALAPLGRVLPPLLGSGREQLAAIITGAGRETWTHKQLTVLDLSTNTATALTGKEVAAITPAWSSDGKRIAYAAMPDVGSARTGMLQRRIRTVQADGSGQRQLTNTAGVRDEYPRWSADGTRLLFTRIGPNQQAGLRLMRPDGSAVTVIADGLGSPAQKKQDPQWLGYYGHVAWSDYQDWWRGVPVVPPQFSGMARYI